MKDESDSSESEEFTGLEPVSSNSKAGQKLKAGSPEKESHSASSNSSSDSSDEGSDSSDSSSSSDSSTVTTTSSSSSSGSSLTNSSLTPLTTGSESNDDSSSGVGENGDEPKFYSAVREKKRGRKKKNAKSSRGKKKGTPSSQARSGDDSEEELGLPSRGVPCSSRHHHHRAANGVGGSSSSAPLLPAMDCACCDHFHPLPPGQEVPFQRRRHQVALVVANQVPPPREEAGPLVMDYLCEKFGCTLEELGGKMYGKLDYLNDLLVGRVVVGYYNKLPFLIRVDEVAELPSTESTTKSNEVKKKRLRWPYWPRLVQHGGQVNKNRLDRSGEVHKSFFPFELMHLCPEDYVDEYKDANEAAVVATSAPVGGPPQEVRQVSSGQVVVDELESAVEAVVIRDVLWESESGEEAEGEGTSEMAANESEVPAEERGPTLIEYLCAELACGEKSLASKFIFEFASVRELLVGKEVVGYYASRPLRIRIDEVTVEGANRVRAFHNGPTVSQHFCRTNRSLLRFPHWPCVVELGGQISKKDAEGEEQEEEGERHRSYYPLELMHILPEGEVQNAEE